ncbi:PH-domain-containing protein, partial [Backusella circina FSU 941]
MAGLETVFAVHNFDAENDDELTFIIGEPIIVIQRDDGFGDGWWKGQNTKGEVGLFPMNYIHRQTQTQLPTPSTSGSTKRSHHHIESQRNNPKRLHSSISPENWDVDQVSFWLTAMDFGSIADNFKLQDITGDVLLELNMNSLKELDIPTFGKRFKVQNAINALRDEYFHQMGHSRMSVASLAISEEKKSSPASPLYSQYSYRHSAARRRMHHEEEEDDYFSLSSPIDETMANINKPQTVLPMTHPSSMGIYSAKADEGNVTPDMEGWLHKQSCKYKKWNKRWFVLKGANLFYFKSPKDIRMKGIINLRGYRIIPDEGIYPGKYSFKAQHEEERTFFFYTDLESSMRSWITSLMKSTISRDFAAPVLSSNVVPTVSLDIALRMRPRPPSVLLYKKEDIAKSSNQLQKASFESIGKLHPPNNDSGFDSDVLRSSSTQDEAIILNDDEEEEESAPGWLNSDYIQWVNTASSANITLLSELRRGDILIDLLEELSGKSVRSLSPATGSSESVLELDNIVAVFKFMNEEGIEVNDQYTVQEICDGNEGKIMLMLQSILEWS